MLPLLFKIQGVFFLTNMIQCFEKNSCLFSRPSTKTLLHILINQAKWTQVPFCKLNIHNWHRIQFGLIHYSNVMKVSKYNFSIYHNSKQNIYQYTLNTIKYQCVRQVCPIKGLDNSTMQGMCFIPRRTLPGVFFWRAARGNWKSLPELVVIVTMSCLLVRIWGWIYWSCQ